MRKLKLEAVYSQRPDGKWDAHIDEAPHICVVNADDLESARVLLRIITDEEVTLWTRRQNWSIEKETINYHR